MLLLPAPGDFENEPRLRVPDRPRTGFCHTAPSHGKRGKTRSASIAPCDSWCPGPNKKEASEKAQRMQEFFRPVSLLLPGESQSTRQRSPWLRSAGATLKGKDP